MTKNQHINVLQPSTTDTVFLAEEVEMKYLEISQTYLRVKGEMLVFPSYLDSDVVLWRTMRIRHRRGDLRNHADEFKATTNIAQWILKIKAQLTNKPEIIIDWQR